MGNRKCAFENCNALEFRNSEYCLRHKDGLQEEKGSKNTKGVWIKPNIKINYGIVLIISGILTSIVGFMFLQSEPVINWFEFIINPIIQACGFSALFTGICLSLGGLYLTKYHR